MCSRLRRNPLDIGDSIGTMIYFFGGWSWMANIPVLGCEVLGEDSEKLCPLLRILLRLLMNVPRLFMPLNRHGFVWIHMDSFGGFKSHFTWLLPLPQLFQTSPYYCTGSSTVNKYPYHCLLPSSMNQILIAKKEHTHSNSQPSMIYLFYPDIADI